MTAGEEVRRWERMRWWREHVDPKHYCERQWHKCEKVGWLSAMGDSGEVVRCRTCGQLYWAALSGDQMSYDDRAGWHRAVISRVPGQWPFTLERAAQFGTPLSEAAMDTFIRAAPLPETRG